MHPAWEGVARMRLEKSHASAADQDFFIKNEIFLGIIRGRLACPRPYSSG
jgi:hypothetical protein